MIIVIADYAAFVLVLLLVVVVCEHTGRRIAAFVEDLLDGDDREARG